jgi:chaperone modulatory protein CbpM
MKPQPHDWDRPDEKSSITHSELSQVCQISTGDIDELVEYGALIPLERSPGGHTFSRACVASLRTACKLRRDYDLDLFTVALLMEHLIRIEELERELRFLQAHLPAHVTVMRREGPQPWREPHATAGADRP